MMMVGIGFKLALVPFHMWTPDVYQGAPAPVTAYIATVSKGAVMAVLIRFFFNIKGFNNQYLFIVISGIAKGNYIVKCSFVGYQISEIPLLAGELNKNFDLGRIHLIPSSEELAEVTVQAKKEIISSDLDKKTFDIDDNVAQSGGSVLDAMKTMPGVTVDQEGKVLLRGSDKVMVLIDGKQSSLTGFGNQKGLESIPVSNIQSIEIINNPSAKYDATGMAGIINIVYKKETEKGMHGDFGMSLGLGAFTKPKPDLPTERGIFSTNKKYIPSFSVN